MFLEPSDTLINVLGITDVIFSTDWTNEPPVITATQAQIGWSQEFNANLVASNTGYGVSTSGSGIYTKGTTLVTRFSPYVSNNEFLLVATVPIIQKQPKVITHPGSIIPKTINKVKTDIGLIPNIVLFEATPGKSGYITGSSGNLNCTASYTVSQNNSGDVEQYAFITWEAPLIPDMLPAPFQLCSIFHCSTVFDLCGLGYLTSVSASTKFTAFNITGNFNKSYNVIRTASSNNTQLFPTGSYTIGNFSITSTSQFDYILLDAVIISLQAN